MTIITKIEQQKKNINRYSIYLDQEYSFSVSEDTLIKLGLKKGMEVDKEQLDSILKQEDNNACKSYGLKLLGYRARSEKEIRDKMFSKGYSKKSIEEAINYLKEFKYINDEEYTKQYIKDRMNGKKLGHKRIKYELYQKGINKIIIEDKINKLINDDEEYERALEIAHKKMNTSYRSDDKQSAYRKIGAFLQRKGFSIDTILKVLNTVFKSQDYD